MTTLTTIAGTTGRIAGHAARLTFKAGRAARRAADQIDWAEVGTIVGQGLTVLLAMLVAAVPATYRAGRTLRLAIHRAAIVIAREHAYLIGVCPPLEALQPVAAAPAVIAAAPAPAKRPRPQPAPQPVPAMVPAPVPALWAVPLDRAVSAVRCGKASQRQAAKRYGISRTSLQRALAAA